MDSKTLTVGDILRLVPEKSFVRLTHYEEDTRKYINSLITEDSSCRCFVKSYGWEKLDGMAVKEVRTDALHEDISFLHITYGKEA